MSDFSARSPLAVRPVAVVAAAVVVVLLATSPWYGYHRDELYYRILGQDLSWGYYDQLGPATPLLIRVSTGLLGDTLFALRLPCALLAAATVVLTASLARELGGGRRVQLLAAVGTAVSAFPLMLGHSLLTSALDLPLSALALLFAARALLRAEPRWWLATGLVLGIATYNKLLLVLIALSLLVGLLIVGPRNVFRQHLLWTGILVAVLVALPNLIFQSTHGWPALEVASGLTEDNGTDNRIAFVPLQLGLLGPLLLPVWITGLIGLLRDPRWRPVRALAVAYPLAAIIVLITGGRADYVVPLLLVLLAAGCVRTDAWLDRGAGRSRWLAAGFAVNGAIAGVIALPLVPLGSVGSTPVPAMNQLVADQIGWPELADQVAGAYRSLPADERPNTVVVTSNYGEAAGLRRFGPAELSVYSGHNHLHRAGPPPESARTVIAVGLPGITALFESCSRVSEIRNDAGVDNEEEGRIIQVCRGPRQPWGDSWSRFQHYD